MLEVLVALDEPDCDTVVVTRRGEGLLFGLVAVEVEREPLAVVAVVVVLDGVDKPELLLPFVERVGSEESDEREPVLTVVMVRPVFVVERVVVVVALIAERESEVAVRVRFSGRAAADLDAASAERLPDAETCAERLPDAEACAERPPDADACEERLPEGELAMRCECEVYSRA